MTEKRFRYIIFDGFEDNGKEMSPQEVEETLNKFQELSMEDYKKIKRLEKENEQLKSENKRLTDKLNKTALELVDECISQGKATEISEMSYREFLDYRAENGKPMELHL